MSKIEIKGLRLYAIDKGTGARYSSQEFSITKIDGCFYGVINENSTDRKILELRVLEEGR